MIGYVITDGNAGGRDPLKTALRSNGQIMVFSKEKAASKFRWALESYTGLEIKDLYVQKVSIKPIFPKD